MHAAEGLGGHLHFFKCNVTHTLWKNSTNASVWVTINCHYASIFPQQGRKFQYCNIRTNGWFFYEKGAVVGSMMKTLCQAYQSVVSSEMFSQLMSLARLMLTPHQV